MYAAKSEANSTPMLFPYETQIYWDMMRKLIREEIKMLEKNKEPVANFATPGLTYKPLYKMNEVCAIFKVTRPTVYDWIKREKLKPFKIRSRVYFLANDIVALIGGTQNILGQSII